MSPELIKKYMQILIKNLEFSSDTGRQAVIEVLTKIVEVLPMEILQTYVSILFWSS